MALLALAWVRFRERLRKAPRDRGARAVNPDPAALGT
jgi:hypothetical protein